MMLVRLFFALVTIGVARPAMSDDIAADNGFYAECNEDNPTTKTARGRFLCLAYVKGLYDMAAYLQPASKAGLVCSPDGVTIDQYSGGT
jgi:hypothetical protein